MARSPSDSTWRAAVQTRIDLLEDEVTRVRARFTTETPTPVQKADCDAAEREIEIAQQAVKTPSFWKVLWRWGSGSDVETAWRALHAAEAWLIMVQDSTVVRARIPELRASLVATLGPQDSRVGEYNELLKAWEPQVDAHRAQIRMVKTAVDAASDEAHSNVRNYRNWLLIMSAVTVAGLVGVAIAHAANEHFLFVCQAKASGGKCPTAAANVTQVEVAGGIAGLITALFALIRLKVFSGPYALPLWQALIRVPAGAAGALLGVLVMQSGLLDTLMADSEQTVIAYAVVFGVSPEIVLRTLDQKVNDIGAAASSKDDPLKPVPPPPPAK